MDKNDIIKKYEDILNNYIKVVSQPLVSKINFERSKYSYILDRLIQFYFFTGYLADKRYSALDHNRILFSISAKSALDLLGIYHCLFQGLEMQAGQIFRSLFETYVNVNLMLRENQNERIKLYSEFEHVERWNRIIAHKILIEKGVEEDFYLSKEEISYYEDKYKNVQHNYHPTNPYHWAWKIFNKGLKSNNPSIKSICQYLGKEFEKDYVQAYGTDSIFVHGSPVLIDYFSYDSNIVVNSPKFTDNINYLGALAIFYCKEILSSILNYSS